MAERSYKIRDLNDLERSFRVVASTATPIKNHEWDPDNERPVEYLEALEGWDFSRYEKNPLVLESHNAYDIDAVIGQGSDWKETDDGGFEMKITLGTSDRAQELFRKVKEGTLRGVSVGWDYGERSDEVRGGRQVRVYRNNKLNEVSLCLIPKDEDALVELEDEENRHKARLSIAGKTLATGRKPKSDAADSVIRLDYVGRIGRTERTSWGGLRIPARLTRTGILEYRRSDGTVQRELRLPEEVFNSDSLATLRGAPVTDLAHHRSFIAPENWRDATRGHVDAIRKDGKYVAADVFVSDAEAVAAVERGELHDISCGYSCKLDFTPGEYEGQRYDAIQRFIRYNHVAVLPKGKGRAGTDVALRLDAKDAVCVEADPTGETMPEPTKRIIRIDGKDLEYGSEAHINHIESAHAKAAEAWKAERTELTKKLDTLEAKLDAAEKAKVQVEEELKEETEGEKARSRVRSRIRLLQRVIRFLEEDEEDEEKMDALEQLSDRELMLKVIKADAKFADADISKKSDDYITALFDAVSKDFTRADGVDGVVREVEKAKRHDAKSESPVEKALRERRERFQKQSTEPLSLGK